MKLDARLLAAMAPNCMLRRSRAMIVIEKGVMTKLRTATAMPASRPSAPSSAPSAPPIR